MKISLDSPYIAERENSRHYIPASEQELRKMMDVVGISNLEELYHHIPEEVRYSGDLNLPEELEYDELSHHLQAISEKNQRKLSFIGDGLPQYKVHSIVPFVSSIRNLTTAYTPYQPERSQGTLVTHWIYQSLMSQLTGFEAINSSLYDRSTALYESLCVGLRLKKNATHVVVSQGIYPGDLEVVRTHIRDTSFTLIEAPMNEERGIIDIAALEAILQKDAAIIGTLAFPQINTFGNLEDVDALTDLGHRYGVKVVAIIDPITLATGGLKSPTEFGAMGADMLVGEGQHLAIGPNFGGPGLGVFGIRYNDQVKNDIRQTPGRFVGKSLDEAGRECRVMVLSTREQHIRKEKATSNICSNQAFLATLAGAAILARGETGMRDACVTSMDLARIAWQKLSSISGVRPAFANTPFFNEFTIEVSKPVTEVLQQLNELGIHAGVDVSARLQQRGGSYIKLSFSDWQNINDIEKLAGALQSIGLPAFEQVSADTSTPAIPTTLLRQQPVGLPQFSEQEIREYYQKLGTLNVSPDNGCYPLGSCTMKYNPVINDWAASLSGFTDIHPQAPVEDIQGCLEILYQTQEWFKVITGLAGVTTQPVAGAQGELVGLKMFQAYHRARGDQNRNLILIPKSAHGTNFATAAMAGFDGSNGSGIVLLDADSSGQIEMEGFLKKIEEFGPRISGIMITNPNTGGIFETRFKEIADKIHEIGGLVYMDGANMNAIAGWIHLAHMGVDAIHNNLHKTWTIPHGGGGPGDAIVAVSHRLVDFLPGMQVVKEQDRFYLKKAPQSIGSFHRHWGNFAHKIRSYTYLRRLGYEGIRRMSAVAVLSSRYMLKRLEKHFPTLPAASTKEAPRMHEFILTLSEDLFKKLEGAGTPKASAIPRFGKLFLDYGFHAPTVAFPEVFGLMVEPTESYRQHELDRLVDSIIAMKELVSEHPEILTKVPLFTPVQKIDEVAANRAPCVHERLTALPALHANRVPPSELLEMPIAEITEKILQAFQSIQQG
jgi:glycine dehydrogenase